MLGSLKQRQDIVERTFTDRQVEKRYAPNRRNDKRQTTICGQTSFVVSQSPARQQGAATVRRIFSSVLAGLARRPILSILRDECYPIITSP